MSPNTVASLLLERGDVLMVGSFSGLTICHTASLIAEKQSGDDNGPDRSTVFVCVGDRTEAQREALQETAAALGCKSKRRVRMHIRCVLAADRQTISYRFPPPDFKLFSTKRKHRKLISVKPVKRFQ